MSVEQLGMVMVESHVRRVLLSHLRYISSGARNASQTVGKHRGKINYRAKNYAFQENYRAAKGKIKKGKL